MTAHQRQRRGAGGELVAATATACAVPSMLVVAGVTVRTSASTGTPLTSSSNSASCSPGVCCSTLIESDILTARAVG